MLSPIIQSVHFTLNDVYHELVNLIIQSVHFIPNDVYHELVNLDVSKACGPDHMTPKLLKLSAEFISEPLSKLFNLSMSSGSLPRDWTIANVIPIHKKGERCQTEPSV